MMLTRRIKTTLIAAMLVVTISMIGCAEKKTCAKNGSVCESEAASPPLEGVVCKEDAVCSVAGDATISCECKTVQPNAYGDQTYSCKCQAKTTVTAE